MKLKITALIRLTRYREYLFFVIITTLLGARAAYGLFGWRLVLVLVANWLGVAFAFMINDVEDSPEDALNPAKVNRNPVSGGLLSIRDANIASFSVAAMALMAYSFLGVRPFLAGLVCLLLGFLYSWRPVRLKVIPCLDLISHCLMLAGLQYLAAYFSFQPNVPGPWVFPFILVVTISLYGELFNELRDYKEDVRAGLTHTATLLGLRKTYWLMMSLAVIGVCSGLATVFWADLFPVWVLLLALALAAVFFLPALLRARKMRSTLELQQSFQKPLEVGTALALLAQFTGVGAFTFLIGKLF
jgi:4-hydroxybenzoate polyprenyltransferase